MPTTRSKAKKDLGDIPRKPLPPCPKPSKQNSKVGPSQAPRDLETTRNDRANLLQILHEKQKQELDDVLGTEDHGSSGHSCSCGHVHGHGCVCGHSHGYGHGCGRGGRQNGQVIMPVVEDTTAIETLGIDDPDRNVGYPFIQLSRTHLHIWLAL